MSIIQSTAKSGTGGFYDFPIEQSLRFDGTSSYLSRTFGSGSTTKISYSFWVKRNRTSSADALWWQLYNSGYALIYFLDDKLRFFDATNNNTNDFNADVKGDRVFRDLTSWYHVLISVDATQSTLTDKIQIYINGQIEIFQPSAYFTDSVLSSFNQNTTVVIGQQSNSNWFNGYLANIQFIDGQALDQYFFGEFKDNIWVPYNAFSTAGSGTATASDNDTATDSYGTNGFHLTFEDGIESLPVSGYTGNQNAFRDKSHNTNHWKIN